MHLVWLLLFQTVITLAADSKHHAASNDLCAIQCTGVSSEVKYDVGRSYVFDVRSRTTLKMNEERDIDVIQSAQAHISVHSPCEFSLKLTQTSLQGMDVGSDWSSILERSSLRFAFDDGEVKAICPHSTDPIWAVNIKRAILSAFQTKHEGTRETDISGDCPVSTERQKTNEVLKLRTIKELNSCYRDYDIAGVRTTPYRINSKIQVSLIMEAKQICERQISRDNLQQVNCIEDYSLTAPFGEQILGSLHVEQTLRAIGIENVGAMESFSERQSIVFDHSDDNSNTKGSSQHAKAIIDKLCESDDRVHSDAAYYFGDLISNLRGLSMMEISSIANLQCDAFIDALATCGSHACLQQLANLINSGRASESIYSSFALLSNPKEGSMNSVAAFIEKVPLHGLLPISSLVQSYCIAHPMCATQTSVQHIIHSILSKLPSDCSVGEEFEEIKKAIIILKSIGNIGYEEHSLSTILACITNSQSSNAVKIAAIDALRRKPCSDQRNSKLIELFRNQKVDIEVRINSFRQLMECVNDEILEIIIEQLRNETINQVGSYVWSYLNAKQRSTNPASRNLQYMLKRFHISQRYNLDLTRFSRYYELGYFDRENNYGGHMDTSVLLVPKSYIPREVSFNFTVHLFGKSVNLLEIGVRSEGLEKVEEELFGPDGYISNPNGHVFREKQFQTRYSKLNHLKEMYRRGMDENRIRVTFSIRMFGDDLYYYGFQKDQQQLLDEIKESIEVDRLLAKLTQGRTGKLSRYMLLHELSRTLPTLSGLSLQFAKNLSLAIKISGEAKLNMMDVLVGKTDANGFLKLHPSISIVRNGATVLRAGHVVSGALLTSRFHAATSVVQSVEINERRKLLLKIDVPHKDILITKMRNDFTKIESNHQRPFISSRHIGEALEKHYCSGDTLAKILGIRACLNVYANFPIMEGSVEIGKVDEGLNSYQFLIERSNDSGEQKLLVSIDTPGSRINRKIETNIEISIPRKKFKVGIVAPFKTIVLDGNLQQMQHSQDYATTLQLLVDDKVYLLDGIVKATKMEERNLYKLNAKSVAESVTAAEVMAEVQYSVARPYAAVNFHLDKIFNKPIIFKMLINPNAPQYEGKLEYSASNFNMKLDSSIIVQGIIDVKGMISGEYQMENQLKQTVEIGFEQAFQKKGSDYHFKHVAHAASTAFSEINFQILSDRIENNVKNSLDITYFGKKLTANLDVSREANSIYNAVGMIKCDPFDINTKANIVYQNRFPLQFMLKIDIETPRIRNIHTLAEYAIKIDPKWNFNGNILLRFPGSEIVLRKQIDEVTIGKYKMETHLQWDLSDRIDAISDIVFRPRENEYGIESIVNIAGVSEPINIRKHIKYQSDNYNIQWHTKQGGRTIYELNANLIGHFGDQQQFNFNFISEKFEPQINYYVTIEFQPTAESITAVATVRKDGKHFGTGNILVPKKFTLPNQQYRGEFSWISQDKSRKVAIEYKQLKDTYGSSHAVKVQSDDKLSLSTQFDLRNDKMIFKCDLDNNNIRTISTILTATPFFRDSFEIDGHFNTDTPLQQRSIKAKAAFLYRINQANVEGLFEVNGKRYAIESHWRKSLDDIIRHYIYAGKFEIPEGRISLEQQLQVEGVITVRKATTIVEFIGAGRIFNLTNEMECNDASFTTATNLIGNGLVLRHKMTYNNNKNGERVLKKYLKYNEREINMDTVTIYRNREVTVDISASSTFQPIQYAKVMFNCQKSTPFWNCNLESNVNNQYVIKGREMLSLQNTDIGYLVKLGNVMNSEGKLQFNIDNQASKYDANVMLRYAENVYSLEMDVNDNRGTVKLQTPTYTIGNSQMRIVRKGPTEFEVNAEGERGGKIYAHIRTGDYDKLLLIQITEILESFQLHLENSLVGEKQKLIAKLTLDPLGQKKTYGVENEIESEGETFRALRLNLKQPKRIINIEILRPTQNKYILSVQPNVNGRRHPTVVEITYQTITNGYHLEGSISDQALKTPLSAKIVYKKDERDKYNYRLDLRTEFVYSNDPNKSFINSFHLHRSSATSDRKRRMFARHAEQKDGNARFVVELKSSHLASNLDTHLWTKIDRHIVGNAVIPVHATFGLKTKNLQHRSVEYLLEMKMDAIKFMEIQLKSPKSVLKARIDKINIKHYKFEFYKNNERPSVVSELRLHDNAALLEYRNENLQEVKLHASAQKLNDYEGRIDVWHSEAKKKIQDAHFSVQVEEDNVWKSKVYLRPAMENEIIERVKEAVPKSSELHQYTFMKDAFLPIFFAHNRIANDVAATLDEAVKEWTDELRNFAIEFGSEYANLVDEIDSNYEMIKETILVAYDRTYQEMEKLVKSISNTDFINRLQQFKDDYNDIQREIIDALKPIRDLINQLYNEMDNLQRNAAVVIDRLEDTLKLKDLRRALEEYKENFEQIDIIQSILHEMRKISRQYQLPKLERMIVDVEMNRRRYEGEALEVYTKIKNFLLDKIIVSALSKVTSAISESLNEIQIRQNWQQIIAYLRGKITANEIAQKFWKQYVPIYKRLSPGEYELQVTVPYGVTSLSDALGIFHPQHFIALKSATIESFGLSLEDQEFAQSLSRTIYTYKSGKLNPLKMIALHKSIAYIIDGNRFISFDGRVFAFHARCEYLLASDLRTQRFALLAIFSTQGRLDAIKIELRGKEVIMHRNGNVHIDGVQVSMPWENIDSVDGANLISVYRKDQWTILKTYEGLRVQCNSQYDICEIILPGRMHGRSNGLLGSNDNEPSNDYNLVDGTPNDQLNVLAEHWAINGECRVNQARDLTYRDDDRCQEYFQSSDSPLQRCFTQIRPKPFEEICSNGGKQQHCTATSAYLQVCSNAGIITALPHECVKCDNDLHLDDERRIERSIVEHDVVFVVEERKCINHHKDKIAKMAQKISQEQQSVRFGWVGFGGEGIHHQPLVHYEQGEALLDISNFVKQTQQSFEPVSGIETPHHCPKKALEFTVKHFPFRFASAKSIVLVMCRKCLPHEHTKMLDMLLEQDITMHLLTLSKFKTSDGSKIIGMDAKQLLDENGAKIGQRTSLLHPHDSCSILAQQTFGAVFSLKHGFLVAASKVTPKREKYCFNCQCTIDGLFSRNVCRSCEMSEPAELASYGTMNSEADSDLQLLEVFM